MTNLEQPKLCGEAAQRRHVLSGLLAVAGSAPLPGSARATAARNVKRPAHARSAAGRSASFVRTENGAAIFYKDWGKGQPIVFSHGWPLNADAWDEQMMFMAARGFRCVAFDRRGHGRFSHMARERLRHVLRGPLGADDRARSQGAVLVGHSTGAGDVARYIGRHGAGFHRRLTGRADGGAAKRCGDQRAYLCLDGASVSAALAAPYPGAHGSRRVRRSRKRAAS